MLSWLVLNRKLNNFSGMSVYWFGLYLGVTGLGNASSKGVIVVSDRYLGT